MAKTPPGRAWDPRTGKVLPLGQVLASAPPKLVGNRNTGGKPLGPAPAGVQENNPASHTYLDTGSTPTASGKVPNIRRMNVTQQQKWLADHGYNVTVDGLEGPQTKLARKAFLNGVAPSYWNKVWAKNHRPGAGGSNPPPGTTGGGGADTAAPVVAPTRTPAATTPVATTPVVTPSSIDPAAYAAAAANTEYAPQLAAANQNLAYQQKQLPESLKDVKGWNQQITNMFNKFGGQTQDSYGENIDAAQGAADNVAQLFGGGTAAEAQAANAPEVANLRALQSGDKSFQDLMQGVFSAQGRDYARRASREGANAITKAQADKSTLLAQKGAAQTKYGMDYTTQKINQDTAQQALAQAAALAPGQLALQGAQVTAAQTEAKNAPALAATQLKTAQAQTKTAIAQANAAALAAGGKLNWADPKVIDSVSNGGVSGAIGAKGGLVLRPDLALQNLLVSAQGAGAPASVIQAGIGKIIRSLNISHGKKQWSRWTWNGKTFVLGPAPKKK